MKLIVGNIKMNHTLDEAKKYIETISNQNHDNVILCPSYIYLSLFTNSNYKICSQNSFYESSGEYTGEISFAQLKSLGINHSLVGHSERRRHFLEFDETLNRKVLALTENEMTPILCVGERIDDYKSGKTSEVLNRQLSEDLKGVDVSKVIVAYESVWSIGSGIIPSMEEITSRIREIKAFLKQNFGRCPLVLYGGSVNSENVLEIIGIDEVDGVLVGGASKNAGEFLNLINLCGKEDR